MSAVRTTSRLVVGLLAGLLLLTLAAPTAGAQDPYGSTTTTVPDDRVVEATCTLSPSEGRVGDKITATVNGVFFEESVDVLFDGVVVGSITAPVAAQAAAGGVAFNGAALPSQAISTSVQITFTIPKAAVGTHLITAVGDTFTCFCNPNGQFRVLAAAAGGTRMPITGTYAALMLVIALVLLLVGRAFIEGARVRRRAASDLFLADEDYTVSSSNR